MSKERNPNKYFTRREFLKTAIAGCVVGASSLLTTGFIPNEDTVFSSANRKNEILMQDGPPLALFINCDASEKDIARELIKQQILHYKNNPDLANSIKHSKNWEKTIESCANRVFLASEPYIVQNLSSLIFVESEGKPEAINPNSGARGLCQLTWETARQTYEKLEKEERLRIGISVLKPDDLFDTETNIIMSMLILRDLSITLPDPSLTFWAYHFGQGNLYELIDLYIATGINLPVSDYDSINNVKKFNLNFIRLINNEFVKAKLDKGKARLDDTQFYVPRLAAAKYFLL
jgi:hypothetical protein